MKYKWHFYRKFGCFNMRWNILRLLEHFSLSFFTEVQIITIFQADCMQFVIHSPCKHMGWNYLWLETDSVLTIQDFYNEKLVLWKLLNGWRNNTCIICSFRIKILHISREEKFCPRSLYSFFFISQSMNFNFTKSKNITIEMSS